LDEALPEVLPERFWCPDSVMAIHFVNVGSDEQLLSGGFTTPDSNEKVKAPSTGSKGDCMMM